MPKARKYQISLEATPYYHCTSRCVRKVFLCGTDENGNNYEHRRQWIEDRILELGAIFCIDVCAYTVMSNHHHVVFHINTTEMHSLGDIDVCLRWHKIFKGTAFSKRFLRGDILNEAEWQTRFKSQALLDEKALAACMVYVDLNPIRAKMAKAPEHSHLQLRKQRGFTHQQLADAVGIHVNQIKRYEAGTTQPTLELLIKFTKALHISLDTLVFGETLELDDQLRMHLEAIRDLDTDDKKIIQEVLADLLFKYQAKRWTQTG